LAHGGKLVAILRQLGNLATQKGDRRIIMRAGNTGSAIGVHLNRKNQWADQIN
jgi:hypothetical protein